MRVRVGCSLVYESTWPTPATLQVTPRQEGDTRILEATWQITPDLERHAFLDIYENACTRLIIPAGPSEIRYDAIVEISGEKDIVVPEAGQALVEDLPDFALHYTLPSRYCLSDQLSDTAWQMFGHTTPGWPRVQAICDWVQQNIHFAYGSSNPLTTAADVYAQRTGVCRDLAHLAVTFCRALNIPARYVFGYLPDIAVPLPDAPMDFCAWMEVLLDGRWYTFDPRNNEPRIGHIVIGRGRDALDVAMVTSYGAATLTRMTVWADEVPSADPGVA